MSKSTSMSKLHVAFILDSVSYFHNDALTYFAKKAEGDTRTTRISRAVYESAQAQYESAHVRAELESRLYELRFDMDCLGESDQLWGEIGALSDTELKALVDEYEAEAASDPTPATVATVDATPATVDPSPAVVEAAPVMDGTTRPDWDSMQTFERITAEDLKAVPALVARGLGFVAMGLCKVAAMGLGAIVGLGIMGLKKVIAR